MNCHCGNSIPFELCCQKIHQDIKQAKSAEELMRSRYSAFVVKNIDFLYNCFHPNTRRFQNKKDILQWASENRWMKLEIIKATKFTVEFKAYYLNTNFQTVIHHEKSKFDTFNEVWYYVDGMHQ